MRNHHKLTLIFASGLLLASCGHTLQSESGLYNVKLERTVKVPVKGFWTWGKGNPYANQKTGSIYIHPLDVSRVQKEYPDLAPIFQIQMQDYTVQAIAKSLRELNAANNTNWVITTNPAQADVCINMALVHFSAQRPGLGVAAKVGSVFAPVPGVGTVVGSVASGDICIECTMRDTKTGQLLMAFKDENRKKARIYSSAAYSRSGNADLNLKEWAQDMADIIRGTAFDRIGNGTYRDRLNERSSVGSMIDGSF